MALCSDCENAALASSGVYCMALHEHIYDETVADECGLYEGPMVRMVGRPGEADIISFNGRSAEGHGGETAPIRTVRAGAVSSTSFFGAQGEHSDRPEPWAYEPARSFDEDNEELERIVTATVDIGYFGRAHNGGQVLETLRRICQQEFGSVEVR